MDQCTFGAACADYLGGGTSSSAQSGGGPCMKVRVWPATK